MKRGEASWQTGAPSNSGVPKTEPATEPTEQERQSKSDEYRGADIPGLKRVSELQFGDIYRMYEGPDMDKYVQPHQNWRTFVEAKPGEYPGHHILSSTRLGQPTDFHYSDLSNRRFETMSPEEAEEKDITR